MIVLISDDCLSIYFPHLFILKEFRQWHDALSFALHLRRNEKKRNTNLKVRDEIFPEDK